MTVLFYRPPDSSETIEIPLGSQESVLDALLRSGVSVPHGCRAGACQSCVMKTDAQTIPGQAQLGLKPTQKLAGYFLSCNCYPTEPLAVSHAESITIKHDAEILSKEILNNRILRLRIGMSDEMLSTFRPGQYVTLWNDHSVGRCYSIASLPEDEGFLEFHIKHIEGGAFSDWIAHHGKPGDILSAQGPVGDCIYASENVDEPLLLSAIGTGLAPLYGIARKALASGHRGKISLILGANDFDDFYFLDRLTALKSQYVNFEFTLVSRAPVNTTESDLDLNIVEGDIYATVKSLLGELTGYRVYICGAASFVRKMKKQCFLQGASMAAIHSDVFAAAR